jgi:hypothetical protein
MPNLLDLTGKRFFKLTVLRRGPDRTFPNSKPLVTWTCQCACGKVKNVVGVGLRSGATTSCGCGNLEKRYRKMIGKRFGRLVICERADPLQCKYKRTYWICKCDCGNTVTILGNSIHAGATKSCGCIREERKLELGLATKRSQFNQARLNAKRIGRTFELSFEEFVKISERKCAYCGGLPSQVKQPPGYNGSWTRNGIDRIDSSRGYVSGNCAPCCFPCNWSKSNRTVEEFIGHSIRVARHVPNADVYSLAEYAKGHEAVQVVTTGEEPA